MALKLLRRDRVLRSTFLREFCVGRCVSSHPGLLRTLAGPLQTPQYFAFTQEYAPCGDLSGMLQERVSRVVEFGVLSAPLPHPDTHSGTHTGRPQGLISHFESNCAAPRPNTRSMA